MPGWLLVRMAMWLRRPPSRQFITVAIIVVAVAAVLYAVEAAGLWPEWATSNRPLRGTGGIGGVKPITHE